MGQCKIATVIPSEQHMGVGAGSASPGVGGGGDFVRNAVLDKLSFSLVLSGGGGGLGIACLGIACLGIACLGAATAGRGGGGGGGGFVGGGGGGGGEDVGVVGEASPLARALLVVCGLDDALCECARRNVCVCVCVCE